MSNLDWEDVPSEPYYPERSRFQLRQFFAQLNRRRWNRLQKEYQWLRKEMKDMGLNPEDARFLL